MTGTKESREQVERFKEAARELATDESEEAFDRALKKVGSAPPAPIHKTEKTTRKNKRAKPPR